MTSPSFFKPLLKLHQQMDVADEAARDLLAQVRRIQSSEHDSVLRHLDEAQSCLVEAIEQIKHARAFERKARN